MDAAVADLAAHLAVEPGQIHVVAEETVTWPDAALGCPRYERAYDPEPVPGYRITLRHGEVEYRYHGALGEAPFRCEYLD